MLRFVSSPLVLRTVARRNAADPPNALVRVSDEECYGLITTVDLELWPENNGCNHMSKSSYHDFFARTILALAVVFCFRAVPLELKAEQQFKQVTKWPVTQALIRSSAVYTASYTWSGKRNRFCPILDYGYTVQTHTYVGSNSVFDFVC